MKVGIFFSIINIVTEEQTMLSSEISPKYLGLIEHDVFIVTSYAYSNGFSMYLFC